MLLCYFFTIMHVYAEFKVYITSNQQSKLDDYYVFKTNAIMVIHDQYHVIADTIKVDLAKKNFFAEADVDFGVKIETSSLLVLAKSFEYDSLLGEGTLQRATIQLPKGYVTAEKAMIHSDGSWELLEALYTPCDAYQPHWRIVADRLTLYSDSIDACKASLIIKQCPVAYLPRVVMPLQNKSKTGLLFPTISYHAHSGPGFKQQYYWYIQPHADSTLGIDWQNKRGIFATGNVRWARSENESLVASGYAGRVWNVYVQRDDVIALESRNRYWLQAHNTQSFGSNAYMLSRLDCGSDKKMSYQFFDSIQDVDDTSYNGTMVRGYLQQGMVSAHVDVVDTARKRFSDLDASDKAKIDQFARLSGQEGLLNQEQKKELESRYCVWRLPHVEYNGMYAHTDVGVGYRHDFFFDRIAYNEFEIEKIYALSKVAYSDPLVPRNSTDLLRFEYHGSLYGAAYGNKNCLMVHCQPHYQARSKIAQDKPMFRHGESRFTANGCQRVYVTAGVEWSLPDVSYSTNEGYGYSVSPKIAWEFIPAMYQKHWYAMDQTDCIFPKNELSCSLRGSGIVANSSVGWALVQRFEFFDNGQVLPLRRSLAEKTIQPLMSQVLFEKDRFGLYGAVEYDVRAQAIVSFESSMRVEAGKLKASCGYLYYNLQAQEQRKLLSNIPHYFFLHAALPLNKKAKIHYGGQFFIEQERFFRPLIHQLKFEYDGHCWGFYCGVEEKVYRESGVSRRDQSIVISIHFDSLGSVGKKFKSPYFAV